MTAQLPGQGDARVRHATAPSAPPAPPRTTPLDVPDKGRRLTHYLLRYPAKFHPPVVRALIERYSSAGDVILDPFCGSGTLLVEAAVAGRHSIGTDVDPLAVTLTNAKVHRHRLVHLRASARALGVALAGQPRSADEYEERKFIDLEDDEYERELGGVAHFVPTIPNLDHWFRRYVTIDLAKIRRTIAKLDTPETHRAFFNVVFASIIRNASNADPVPVSGLEVTKWMRQRDKAGRLVNPFALFTKALASALDAAEEYAEATTKDVRAVALVADATQLRLPRRRVHAVITSPPYHGAVDYYRRHQLEMFWLGLTATQQDRLGILQQYIGRPHVPARHEWVNEPLPTALAKEWETRIRDISAERANGFRHYLTAMTRTFESLALILERDAPAVFVVGHSTWNNSEIPTTDLFAEISGDAFRLDEVLSYDVKNRYMSYERHNAASIGTEYVLVLRRT